MEGTDWQQSGNNVDWLGSGNEPAIGTTYTVRWAYVKQMVKGTDYVDGGMVRAARLSGRWRILLSGDGAVGCGRD